MKECLLVKPLVEGLKPITPAHPGEWIDLRCAQDIELEIGESRKIPLGIAVELPKGYEAHILPRSSTYDKWGIIMGCHMGVIDNLYCGDDDEWTFPAIALRKTKIHKNDRICQFRIVKQQPDIDIVMVKHLGNANRGGFGSTGGN